MRYVTTSDGLVGHNEGIRALLSVVVIVVGTWLMGETGQAGLESNVFEATGDIVGVWSWVAESPADEAWSGDPVASFFEFRQADSGLMARVMLRDRSGSSVEKVTFLSYEDGQLCLQTAGGAEFRGSLGDDGRTIDGVIDWHGVKARASLERVVTRKRSQVMVPLRDA
jgi:hypothetical protein